MSGITLSADQLDKTLEVMKALKERVEKAEAASSPERINELVEEQLAEFKNERQKRMIYPGGAEASKNPRSYRSLFFSKGERLERDGWKSFDEFAEAIKHRVDSDSRLQKSWNEGIPSDGGFAVPTEYAAQIFDAAVEEQVVLPLAKVYPMLSDKKKISATVIGNHSANLFGGVVGYWKNEADSLTQAEPQYRSIELTAEKLTVYGKSSNEWIEDAPGAMSSAQSTFVNGLGWYLDRAFLKGNGAGQPLGVLNSPCTITQAIEDGQTATLAIQNLNKMLGRLHPACWKNSVWVAHVSLVPYILGVAQDVGTDQGNQFLPNFLNLSGAPSGWTLLTRPIIFTEKLNTAGSLGDIMLCDFSQYAVGLRREMRYEISRDLYFATDELAHRGIVRVDGQPLWNEALTLEDGTTTVSPFVTLAAR